MSARDALVALHDRLWDANVGLVRVPPGAMPAHERAGLDLHSVRETALGAGLDLRRGNTDRAIVALRSVLALQHRGTGQPWSGTFRVCAEEPEPQPGAVEWVDYDPNWRQFLGCILAHTVERHAPALPADLVHDLVAAVDRCVAGEPHDRIPAWYTNPNLLHAWLTAWAGARAGDGERVAAGEARLDRAMARLQRLGDVDEYNSPTYDGIDLFAAALWTTWPPSDAFATAGAELAAVLGGRLGQLFHPRLAALCGPYIRAYGLALDRSVSLAGVWLARAGADRVLPAVLDEHTDHVHDLYFLDLFDDLAHAVLPHLTVAPVDRPRRHEQRFGDVVAVSHLDRDWCIGAERGRIHRFARDQYVPFTVHHDDHGEVVALGVKLGDATATFDASITNDGRATLVATGEAGSVELLLVATAELVREGAVVTCGRLRLTCASEPDEGTAVPTPQGWDLTLRWDAPTTEIAVALDAGAPGRADRRGRPA